jgi:hypothetical protein
MKFIIEFKRIRMLCLLSGILFLTGCHSNKNKLIQRLAVKDRDFGLLVPIRIKGSGFETFSITTNTYLYNEIYLKNRLYNRTSFKKFLAGVYDNKILIDSIYANRSNLIICDDSEKADLIYYQDINEIILKYFHQSDKPNELIANPGLEDWRMQALIVRMFKENYIIIINDFSGELTFLPICKW